MERKKGPPRQEVELQLGLEGHWFNLGGHWRGTGVGSGCKHVREAAVWLGQSTGPGEAVTESEGWGGSGPAAETRSQRL